MRPPLFLPLSLFSSKVRRSTDRVKSRAPEYMGSSTPSLFLLSLFSSKVRRSTDRDKSRAPKYMGSSTPSLFLLSLSFPSKSVEIRTGSIRGLLNTWVQAPPLFFSLSLSCSPLNSRASTDMSSSTPFSFSSSLSSVALSIHRLLQI